MQPLFKHTRSILGLSTVLSLIGITGLPSNANQIPTSGITWTGTSATGTGNAVPATKDTPSGLRMRVSVGGSGTGILARNNTTLMTQGTILNPVLPTATNGLQLLTDLSNCPNGATVLTCSNLGTFAVEFLDTTNTPIKVRNPIIHWSRLGGSKSLGVNSYLASVILQLTTPNLKFASASGSSLAVSAGLNNDIRWAFPVTPPATAGVCATTTSSAGCGSTPIQDAIGGNIFIDRLDFSVTGIRTNASIRWNETDTNTGLPTVTQDGYFITASFEEDFGDAPASFDTGGAASHIISDLALGSAIDVDNINTTNGGATGTPLVASSPNAVAAGTSNNGSSGDGIEEDGVTTWDPLTPTATTYSTIVALSGVSRAARVCGWVDFNRNNAFDNPTERACADIVVGQTSAVLNWTGLSGLTAGNNYARLRLSYDLTGVQNPKGALNSGEVEDYQITIKAASLATVSINGTVFNDADGNVVLDGTDGGTNAASGSLTIYAIDSAGKVVDKATVAPNGTYSLANVPMNANVTLRLSNTATIAVGATAPTAPSRPTGWYHTGENLNGTIDAAIGTLGDIAVTVSSTGVSNQNFGIRQGTVIAPDPATATCNPDFRTGLNTGINGAGQALPVGSNDLNWSVEWIPGPTTGPETPYATPRPVGPMPAVVVGNLAPGAWINEPANARWISYPFRLSTNSNGDHNDADFDGTSTEDFNPVGTSDAVRLRYTSSLTLPTNANITSVSVPIGVSIDNQFVSIKVNGVENLIPSPVPNPGAANFLTLNQLNITQGWQPGVNTIEVITDSGPNLTGFFLSVEVTSTQVCSNASPNLLLVKRITAINGGTNTVGGDSLAGYIDELTNAYDDNDITIPTHPTPTSPAKDTDKWPTPSTFLLGGINGGNIKPGDEMEYTIYFLSAGSSEAKNVLFCDRVPTNVSFIPTAFNSATPATGGLTGDRGILSLLNGTTTAFTNIADGDAARYFAPGIDPTSIYPNLKCGGVNDNGAIVVELGNLPNATTIGTPAGAFGFVRFKGRVK